ncbi:MAG: carboxypeptidase regulatory-like domain-containing protein [Planctomycetes bacterium]|nr:carboxypeptidase regulatory-like domain-containing protein [Planctomycetota bacterium]
MRSKKLFKIILIETLLLLSAIMITSISMAEEQPRYYTERGKMEILADAPWRVSSSTAIIPIEVVVKDAFIWTGKSYSPVILKSIYIDDVNAGNRIKIDNSVDGVYPGAYWERVYNSLRASDFIKENNNVNIKVVFNYSWYNSSYYYWSNDTFTQYLRVWVGSSLPSLPNWYGGDTHYHSEYSGDIHYSNWDSNPDEVTEFGGSLKGTVYAARAMGLDWTCVTDHAYYLDDGTWDEYVQAVNNIRADFGFNMILGEEVSPRTEDNEDCSLHLLVFGMSKYVVGDEHIHTPFFCDEHCISLSGVLHNIDTDTGGFAFGAHPFNGYTESCSGITELFTHLWMPWHESDYSAALNIDALEDTFIGFQFWNTRNTIRKITLGGSYPDEIPAPPLPGDPHPDGGSMAYNPNWADELLKGVEKWDELNLRYTYWGYNTIGFRKVLMIGGSDAHGHFNYEVNASWETIGDNDATQNNSAFGKVRTYVYCPGGNTKNNVLAALKAGNSIITDGPVVIFGIDKNRDGDINDGIDIIIGEEAQRAEGENPTFLIQWKSTEELGRIRYIDIIRGEGGEEAATTIQRLATCAYCHVDGGLNGNECTSSNGCTAISNAGLSGSFEYTDSTVDQCKNYYYRIEAVTTERPEHSPYYPYCRVYTNPIWLFRPPVNNLRGWVIESGSSILPKLIDDDPWPPIDPPDPISPPGTPIPDVWMAFSKVSGPGPEPSTSGMFLGDTGRWWWWAGCIYPGTTYRVTPTKAGYTFNPPYFEFNRNTIPAEDVIFEGTEATTTTTTTTIVFPSITIPTKPPTSTTITTTSTTTTTLLCQCPADSTSPTGCISGRVTDLAGNPLANKKVKLKMGTTLVNTVITDVNGCYWFINLTDGTYKIILKCCKTCTALRQTRAIAVGGHVNGVNFECE